MRVKCGFEDLVFEVFYNRLKLGIILKLILIFKRGLHSKYSPKHRHYEARPCDD